MDGAGEGGGKGFEQWRLWLLGAGLVLLVVLAPKLAPQPAAHFGRIAVEGQPRFVEKIDAALSLLAKKDPQAYGLVERQVARITQGRHSGMWAYEQPPRMEVGERTANSSTTWLAGAIAHDSMHSKLYSDGCRAHGGPARDEEWAGTESELTCCRYQTEVLKRIGAPQAEIDWCSRGDGTHADVNHDGKLDWKDYEARDW